MYFLFEKIYKLGFFSLFQYFFKSADINFVKHLKNVQIIIIDLKEAKYKKNHLHSLKICTVVFRSRTLG